MTTFTTHDFERKISSYIHLRSGMEIRSYLGISQVAKCPLRAYRAFMEQEKLVEDSDFHHRMCYVGYLFEFDTIQRLRDMRIAKLDRREVEAPFDDRLRGHIDGTTMWGDLLEVKSVTVSKFELIQHQNRALHEHIDQVTLYMRYGGWRYAWIIYVCRETFEHKVIRVPYDSVRGDRLEEKAKMILAAIDSQREPRCECGHCNG